MVLLWDGHFFLLMNPTDILFFNPCLGNDSVSWKVRSQAQCSFSCKQIIVTPFVVSPITHPLQDHYTSLYLHNRYCSSLDSSHYTSGLRGLLTIKPCYPCWYFVGLYNTRGIPELERKYASSFLKYRSITTLICTPFRQKLPYFFLSS